MGNDFRRIAELIDQRRTFVIASVAHTQGSTPRKSGARMIVFPDGSTEGTIGGGAMEEHVKREAAELFRCGGARLVTVNLRREQPHSVGGICGGDVQLFLEKIEPPHRLVIFGAGHCGRVLARMADELGFRLAVQDDRPDYADPQLFPQGADVIHGPFERAAELTDPQPTDLAIIMTYAWPKDQLILRQLADRPLRYLGMIGSRYKCRQVLENLRAEGVEAEKLDRVFAPIGLEIGAHTPGEVAVSILAQIVQQLNLEPAATASG